MEEGCFVMLSNVLMACNQHRLLQQSKQKTAGGRDFYIWHILHISAVLWGRARNTVIVYSNQFTRRLLFICLSFRVIFYSNRQ